MSTRENIRLIARTPWRSNCFQILQHEIKMVLDAKFLLVLIIVC